MTTLRERIDEYRTIVELFPRCVKCGGSLEGEKLSNLVEVVGRARRLMHGKCPRASEAN